MTITETADEDETIVPAQLRGETIAYALQSGFYNLGANFFEPYVGYRLQKHINPAKAAHGSYTQNLMGEFAGDVIGSSALILAETVMPAQLHAFSRTARSCVDPLYTSVAHMVLAKHSAAPDYEQKVEHWKTFQERNLVRSAIVMSAGIAGNIATQKLLAGNPSPVGLILKGKLLGCAITTTLGLAVRFAFPSQMNRIDNWMGKRIAPMMDDVEVPDNEEGPDTPHANRLERNYSLESAPAR